MTFLLFCTIIMTIVSTELNLIYKLKGGDASAGIDVFKFAPALLSVGELVREGHKTLHPREGELAINVRPFQEGSFIIDILLFYPALLQATIDIAQNTSLENLKSIKTSLEAIGLIKGILAGGSISLIALAALLKGEKLNISAIKKIGPNLLSIHIGNTNYTFNDAVFKLISNKNVEKMVQNIGEGLEKIDVDGVESYIKEDEEKSKVTVKKEEIPLLRKYSIQRGKEEEEINENTTTVYLNPQRGSFIGESRHWSFTRGSAAESIQPIIKDEDFLKKIMSGKIRLTKNDTLKVRLKEIQKIKEGVLSSVVHEILEVQEYTSAPNQGDLFEDSQDEE